MKLLYIKTIGMAALLPFSAAFNSPCNQKQEYLSRFMTSPMHMDTTDSVEDVKIDSNKIPISLSNSRRSFLQKTTTFVTAGIIMSKPALAFAESSTESSTLKVGGNIRYGDENIMSKKIHGTSSTPVQDSLKYGVSGELADKICSFNRHFAESSSSYMNTSFPKEMLTRNENNPMIFYDSVTGKALFQAPVGRSTEEFLEESKYHGWPSFRDQEVVWENVRALKNSGETVSVDGTHLGHNLPDRSGNRYCINLVSIAGNSV